MKFLSDYRRGRKYRLRAEELERHGIKLLIVQQSVSESLLQDAAGINSIPALVANDAYKTVEKAVRERMEREQEKLKGRKEA